MYSGGKIYQLLAYFAILTEFVVGHNNKQSVYIYLHMAWCPYSWMTTLLGLKINISLHPTI